MTKEQVLEITSSLKQELSDEFGVSKIGIFGSFARNENVESSDIDFVIELNKSNIFTMVHIKDKLESVFLTNVDLIQYRPNMNKLLKSRIDSEAIYV